MLPGVACAGAPDDARAHFAEARVAFEAEDYSRALRLFEQCLDLGMQGPVIHYNIGVAAYRSGDLSRAERAFREVARTPPMAALAYYNLGLVAQRRGDSKAARGWFQRAKDASSDERITGLASRQLDALATAAPPAEWSFYARGGAGYDDNVALRSESIDTPGTGQGDSFALLLAAGSYNFLPHWRADGAAGISRYAKLDEFDQTALSLGVTRDFDIERWSIDVGGLATRLSLGGDVYEQSAAVSTQAKRPIGPGTLRVQLQIATVDGEREFSGLSGTRTGGGVEYDWAAMNALTFTAHARGENNDCEDDVFASRWIEGGVAARWAMSPAWSFDSGIRLRETRHPGFPEQPAWTDRRTTFRVEASRLLWRQANLFARFEHESTKSPVESYEYDRNWVLVSIEYWR